MELQSFTSNLNQNRWNITRVWKFFAKKNKRMLRKSSSEKAKSFSNRKVVGKLCLRGRYGSGVKSIFSSAMAIPNSETVQKLVNLYPKEEFLCVKFQICQFWIDNPIFPTEVANAIARLPKGKAAGPSGISFDLLKAACKAAPEISKDLANYFQQMVCLKVIPPIELTAARLIALVKPGNGIKPDGIRPIAVGESISRLFASIVFNRVVDKAGRFLSPFQFGIKTNDGASVAALTSNLFFNSHDDNFIFNVDFKNAFNSVSRKSVFAAIEKDFLELTSYFYLFYGKPSDLIYDSYSLKSMSGVKQGDPLGPLFLLFGYS
ncbi:hypothetical protein GEMRC1_002694 [Eukaryota sp. GEM-RC1]